jgi:hypothetical protein
VHLKIFRIELHLTYWGYLSSKSQLATADKTLFTYISNIVDNNEIRDRDCQFIIKMNCHQLEYNWNKYHWVINENTAKNEIGNERAEHILKSSWKHLKTLSLSFN